MKNKIKLKRLLSEVLLISIIILLTSSLITLLEYKAYTKNFNLKIESIVDKVIEEYPLISESEIIDIINNKNVSNDILNKYNIDIDKDSVLLENKHKLYLFIFLNGLGTILAILTLLLLFLKFNKKKDREIGEITKYIEQINKKNYKLNIDDISEDELSILKSEIYKTTVMLKEQASNLVNDKLKLKNSLSDISHQLKTPLTSIIVILDNLLEDADMDKEKRQEFIFDIKREINNINFLVNSLLKLSKLDTNTVNFINKSVSLEKIVRDSIQRLSCLIELKSIDINLVIKSDSILKVDESWQVEAVSNILKNSIEHSHDSGKIDIIISDNKVYSEIIIKDYGVGIDKNDLPHIFERFYKGKNASIDSVGIGLALAKTIIEQAGGKVTVESEIDKYTKFVIRYF